jgi:KDO2-lipid IV(A) lauroyltransferase
MRGRRKSKLRPVRRFLRRAGLRFLPPTLALLGRLSLRGADRLGRTLGRAAFHLLPRLRAQAVRHLGIAFGERMDESGRRRTARASFELFSAALLEWLVLCRLGKHRAAAAVRSVEGWEHVRRAREAGRGLIIVTPHFGLFELMPVYFCLFDGDGKVVGRRHDDRGLDGLLMDMRRSMGVETVFQHEAREMLRILRGGRSLGILPDQDIDKLPGIFVPFFGREAFTASGPASLAVTAGAPIMPAFLHRDGPGRHRLVVRPPIEDPGGDREERVLALTLGWCRVFEREIAAAPAHWAWVHRRWDTTPEALARRRERRARKDGRAERSS